MPITEKMHSTKGTKIVLDSTLTLTQRESAFLLENGLLRSQLKGDHCSPHTAKLSSESIIRSKWANRHEHSFKDNEFLKLKDDISSAGGNVQAIKVRPSILQEGKYEIIFGHRRHQACLELGLPVLAMIETLSEKDLFSQMDRENRERKDLRPYEQGMIYAMALDDGLFPSARKLAEAIGVDLTNLGRALSIARLPPDVINSFPSPLDIQLKWGADIKMAIEINPDVVLTRAKALQKMKPKLDAKNVFATLVSLGNASDADGEAATVRFNGDHGASATLQIFKVKKNATLRLKSLDEHQMQKISDFVRELIGSV